jgi:hypothetical protein
MQGEQLGGLPCDDKILERVTKCLLSFVVFLPYSSAIHSPTKCLPPTLSSGSCFLGQEAVARSEPSGRRTNSTVKYVTINTSVYKT